MFAPPTQSHALDLVFDNSASARDFTSRLNSLARWARRRRRRRSRLEWNKDLEIMSLSVSLLCGFLMMSMCIN